jgi:putative intracellular protease/amidase
VLQLEAELRALDAHTSSLASSSAADAGSSDGASSSSSSSSSDAGASPLLQAQEGVGGTEAAAAAGGAHAQARAQREQLQWAVQAAKQKVASLHDPGQLRPIAVKNTNAYAMCASLLDRANSSSPEYLSALHQWMSQRAALAGLLPAGAVQLWGAAKGQWSKHEGMLAARAASAGAEQAGDGAGSGGSGSGTAHADGGDDADAQQLAAEVAAAAGVGSTEAQLSRLAGFFGPGTLATLADVTVPLVPHMLERELGMLLNALGRLRFANAELVAAVCGAYEALAAAGTPTLLTQATALWAAAQLQRWGDAVLVQPALVSAVAQPDEMTGFVAARVLIATSHMPRDVAAAAEAAVRAELHRRSGARGPAPAAAGGDAAVPLWVSALADSQAGRNAQCRPREIAYILLAYSEIPGVPVHEGLFGAAARHIELHTHTFSQFRDMEMVATAFERMNFRAGLPALEAMQSLTTSMLNGTPGQQ